jgi:hypothetical protein
MLGALSHRALYTLDCVDQAQVSITVAARSKAGIVFARSNAGIVSSNPTRDMDICLRLFCVYVVLCVRSGFATG